jgi:hypothetical protein
MSSWPRSSTGAEPAWVPSFVTGKHGELLRIAESSNLGAMGALTVKYRRTDMTTHEDGR